MHVLQKISHFTPCKIYQEKDTVTFLLNLLQHHYLNELSQACHVKDINLNTTKENEQFH